MRDRQPDRVAALRLILAVIQNQEIAKRAPLADEEVARLLKAEAKKRQDAFEIYEKAKRQELAQKEEFELKIINEFLPETVKAAL